MENLMKIEDVTKTYMASYSLTQQKFADEITASLVNTEISRVSVTNWCNGKSSPSTDFLLLCLVVYKDWRRTWAMECLQVKLPEVFADGIVTLKLPVAK